MHTILAVDPDQAVQRTLQGALDGEMFRVRSTRGIRDTLEQVLGGKVDILITEVHLPDGKAWEMIPTVQRMAPHTPIIILTWDDTLQTSERVRFCGEPVFFYGLKPPRIEEIQQAVYSAARQVDKEGLRSKV